MSTPFYDLASLVVVPSGYKASKVYAQKPLTTDGQLTFSRASTATRVNSAGLIETVSSNVPRLDYLNSSCPRLLLEPQRTNLVTYSEQFDNAGWTKSELTISANASTSPDGYTNADKLVPSTNNATHFILQGASITSGTSYTQSLYAKADGYSFLQIANSSGFSVTSRANFNLSDGTIGSNDAGTATITSVGNGWYRLTYTLTADSTNASGRFVISVVESSTSSRLAGFAGNGTSGILIYGAQLEAGAYVTSYIPTLGAAVTRGADAASKTGISSLIGQTEGVLFVDIVTRNNIASVNRVISITESNWLSGGSIRIDIQSTSISVDIVDNGGSVGAVGGNIAVTANTRYKIALAYKQNQLALYVNGTQLGTSTSTGVMPTCSQLYLNELGGGFGGPYEATAFNQALLFKTRLTNAQLAELTAL